MGGTQAKGNCQGLGGGGPLRAGASNDLEKKVNQRGGFLEWGIRDRGTYPMRLWGRD